MFLLSFLLSPVLVIIISFWPWAYSRMNVFYFFPLIKMCFIFFGDYFSGKWRRIQMRLDELWIVETNISITVSKVSHGIWVEKVSAIVQT